MAVRAAADRPVRAAQLAEKLTEREVWRVSGPEQLVGFDMGSAIDEHILEDALLEWRQRSRDGRKAGTAVATAEPVDRDVVNDSIEEGRELALRLPAGCAPPQPCKIIFAQHFAHAGEHVHHVIRLAREVADRAEDQTAVALDEIIPSAFRVTCFERSDPRFDHRPSVRPTRRI